MKNVELRPSPGFQLLHASPLHIQTSTCSIRKFTTKPYLERVFANIYSAIIYYSTLVRIWVGQSMHGLVWVFYPVRTLDSDPKCKIKFYPKHPRLHKIPNGYQRSGRVPTPQRESLRSTSQRIHLTIPVAIDTERYLSCVCVISASKSAAMAVSTAQGKGQR